MGKISKEFAARLEELADNEQISVIISATEPKGLKKALKGIPPRNTNKRRETILPYYQRAIKPIVKYLDSIGAKYFDLPLLKIVEVRLDKAQISYLTSRDYVETVIENQRINPV